ncbi:MFS transporter [Streptomyces iconiensis]|uniref:MFS transporter n=1 Tax=Streptomyces iconiensis TaxID=1384038 RepID=A0ABT7A8Z9_9ACTN|nr:MFS transporter [Streptomyces iconiensis]MDJ1137517.1 MFS transporter [Streptomyces iconiensis]
MSAATSETAPGPPSVPGGQAEDRLRRLRWAWMPGNIGFNLAWGAVTSVLLALQVKEIDPGAKVGNLALITGLGAAMTMLVQPLAGRLSDRTRSRHGRRAPWIVGGAAAGGAAMVLMSFAASVPALLGAYLLVVIGYNAALLPLSAVLPDRVPQERRGTFAALGATGQMLGTFGGQLLAARFDSEPRTAYWTVALLSLAFAVAFVLVNPDEPSTGQPRDPLRLKDLVASYWVNPRVHSDFAWVFAGRFLLMAGYFISHSYSLYILQDYIGLGDEAVDWVPVLGIITFTTLVVFTLLGGPLSDRVGRRKVFIYAAAAIFAVGLVVPFFLPTLTGMIISAVIGGIGYGVFGSVDMALMTEVLPSREGYGKDLGVIGLSWSLPQTCGPFLAGGIVSATGGYDALFPVGAGLALAGGLAVKFVKKVR